MTAYQNKFPSMVKRKKTGVCNTTKNGFSLLMMCAFYGVEGHEEKGDCKQFRQAKLVVISRSEIGCVR